MHPATITKSSRLSPKGQIPAGLMDINIKINEILCLDKLNTLLIMDSFMKSKLLQNLEAMIYTFLIMTQPASLCLGLGARGRS